MEAKDWTKAHPVGTQVVLTEDDGTRTRTVVRSEAWHLGHGQVVAKVGGKIGGWMVERIERADLTGITRLEILAAIVKGVEAGVPLDLLVKGLLDAAVRADNLQRTVVQRTVEPIDIATAVSLSLTGKR